MKASPNSSAAIGLGANLERPWEMIKAALKGLAGLPGTAVAAHSRIYLSKPQGGPAGQNWYHNGAALLTTSLEPLALLRGLLKIESALGRVRQERWGPRIIDLDLLFYGSKVFAEPELTLPHPRMTERIFVLAPLNELAPGWCHPLTGLTVRQMLAALPPEQYQGLRPISGDPLKTA